MSVEERERKKEHMKNYYYKIKYLLNYLINRIKELENTSLHKYFF